MKDIKVLIMSYDLATKNVERLDRCNFKVVIVD